MCLPFYDVVGLVDRAGEGQVVGTEEPHPVVDDVQVKLVQTFGDGGGDVASEIAKLSFQSVDF